LRSETLQKAHCPVLLALTMAPLERALVCLHPGDQGQVECFGRLFARTGVTVDLLGLDFQESGSAASKGSLELALAEARRTLTGLGLRVEKESVRRERPESMASLLDGYGLLVAPLVRDAHLQQPWVVLLGNASTSMLLC